MGRHLLRRRGGSATSSSTGRTDRFSRSGNRLARATRWCATTARASGCPTVSRARRRLTLEGEVALLSAVLDELALERVALVGGSSGGCAAIMFAARFPERVDRLLLYGAYADGPSITSPAVREAIVATVRSHWGLGSRVLADIFLGEADSAGAGAVRALSARRGERRDRGGAAGADLPQRRPDGAASTCARPRWSCIAVATAQSRTSRARARRGDPGGDADSTRWECAFPVGRRRGSGGARAAVISVAGRRGQPCGGRARRRAALRQRARGAGAGRERAERPRDRRAAHPQPAHGAPPRREHPPQARAWFAYGRGRGGELAWACSEAAHPNRPSRKDGLDGRCATVRRRPIVDVVESDTVQAIALTSSRSLGARIRGSL